MTHLDSSKAEWSTRQPVLRELQTHGRASMSTEDALKELGLTGSGTIDSLTVDLDSGKHVFLKRQEAFDLPVDLITLARRYFDLVLEATA